MTAKRRTPSRRISTGLRTRLSFLRTSPRGARTRSAMQAPADPGLLPAPIDPILLQLRSVLVGHRRGLWLRRAVRRGWMAVASVAAAELVLAVAQRLWPIEEALIVAGAILAGGALGLLALVVRVRPTIGETALAVDAEAGAGDDEEESAGSA